MESKIQTVRIEWTFRDLFIMAFMGIPAYFLASVFWGGLVFLLGFVLSILIAACGGVLAAA